MINDDFLCRTVECAVSDFNSSSELEVVGELGNVVSNIALFSSTPYGESLLSYVRVVGEFDNENSNSWSEFNEDVGEPMVHSYHVGFFEISKNS